MIGGFSKEFVDYYCLNEEAKNSLPARTMKEYLDSDEYWDCFIANRDKGWNSYPTWSNMQLLTIASFFMSTRKRVRYIRRIAEEMECSPEEKTLLRMCVRDLAKNKYRGRISGKTLRFYDIHFRKQCGATFPMRELLFLPVIFKSGDVVVSRSRKRKAEYYLVIDCPDYAAGLFMGFRDELYGVLNLKGGRDLLDEERYENWLKHISSGQLELIPEKFVPGKYRNLIEKLKGMDYMRFSSGSTDNSPVGLHTKEEMRLRIKARIERENENDWNA